MDDMTTFDRVKKLADKHKISIVELEERLDFGRNSLYSWKKKIPNGASLKKVADYFNVSTDYLLGRTEHEEIKTIAAHHDGEEWTDDERAEIERFKEFVRLKRKQQE
jgi:transcriptional regulator with XRE-family HTH domain